MFKVCARRWSRPREQFGVDQSRSCEDVRARLSAICSVRFVTSLPALFVYVTGSSHLTRAAARSWHDARLTTRKVSRRAVDNTEQNGVAEQLD
eukprot:1585010-Pleurochrysis_carterae.AAC.1